MSRPSIVTYLIPWKLRQQKLSERLDALRRRDGDHCRRCRRAIRFDLPRGHDQAPSVQQVLPGSQAALDNLCLCHVRCNAECADNTSEVEERMKRREEAAAAAKPKIRKAPRRRAA